MYELAERRPEPTEADVIFMRKATKAVGPVLKGVVLEVSQDFGSGRIREIGTGFVFSVARKFVSASAFDSLRVGEKVKYRSNGRRAVAELES